MGKPIECATWHKISARVVIWWWWLLIPGFPRAQHLGQRKLGMAHWGLFLVVGPGILPQQSPGFCTKSGSCLSCPEAGSARPWQVYGGARKLVEEELVAWSRGRHSYLPGKTWRGHISRHCRLIAMDGVQINGNGWWWGVGCCAAARGGPEIVCISGTRDQSRPSSSTLVWGMLFGVGSHWHFPPIFIKACVDDRLVLDLRPALRTVSTSPVALSSPLPSCETGTIWEWVRVDSLNHCRSQIPSS